MATSRRQVFIAWDASPFRSNPMETLDQYYIEWFGVVSGLLYVWLEIRQHRAMWSVGLLTSALYVVVFFGAKLYADMTLNLYYVAVSIYGLSLWRVRKSGSAEVPRRAITYKRTPARLWVRLAAITFSLYLLQWYLLQRFTDSPVPSADAMVTAMSITATWMLAKKYLEQWWLWIFINLFSIGLFLNRGLLPTAFLFLVYALMAIVGYRHWIRKGYLLLTKDS